MGMDKSREAKVLRMFSTERARGRASYRGAGEYPTPNIATMVCGHRQQVGGAWKGTKLFCGVCVCMREIESLVPKD